MSLPKTLLGPIVILLATGCLQTPQEEAPPPDDPVRHPLAIARLDAELPDLEESEIQAVLTIAKGANPGAPVRVLEHRSGMVAGYHYVVAVYDQHHINGRIRKRHVAVIKAPDPVRSGKASDDPSRRQWRLASPTLDVRTEVCPVGRSFEEEDPVPSQAILTLEVDAEITDARLLEIVDSMNGRLAERERLCRIEARGNGYEVRTDSGGRGSVFAVEQVDGEWTHRQTGGWVE